MDVVLLLFLTHWVRQSSGLMAEEESTNRPGKASRRL